MRRLLSDRTAGFDRSITIFEDVPRVEFGLSCPRLQRHIALSECIGCPYHQATLASVGGYGVFCRFPVNVAGPMPEGGSERSPKVPHRAGPSTSQ